MSDRRVVRIPAVDLLFVIENGECEGSMDARLSPRDSALLTLGEAAEEYLTAYNRDDRDDVGMMVGYGAMDDAYVALRALEAE